MKLRYLLAEAALLLCVPYMSGADPMVEEMRAYPGRSGGVYYAYPYSTDSLQMLPVGYTPFYISHYGRHGSRWPINPATYDVTLRILRGQAAEGNLTQAGKSLIPIVERCRSHAEGHLGELSPLGERQHKGIAGRMAARFPELFADTTLIMARSSVEPRCIVSMAAFCERLKEINPSLRISRHATPGDMDFISWSSPKAKADGKEDSGWRGEFACARDSLSRAPRAARKIFRHPERVEELPEFMRRLHDTAVSLQDLDGLEDTDPVLLELFSPQELLDLWKASDYIMYVRHGLSPVTGASGALSAVSLAEDIVDMADKAVRRENPSPVDLRFGHDTALVRLLSLLGAEGADAVTEDMEEAVEKWSTWRLIPMAANLQFVFLRDDAGNVAVAPRLHERPLRFPAFEAENHVQDAVYPWNDFRAYIISRLEWARSQEASLPR